MHNAKDEVIDRTNFLSELDKYLKILNALSGALIMFYLLYGALLFFSIISERFLNEILISIVIINILMGCKAVYDYRKLMENYDGYSE
jgi:hypothetical protein